MSKRPTANEEAQPQPETPTVPVLSADEKIHLLQLQRDAIIAENQRLQAVSAYEKANTAYEKAVAALNAGYQGVMSKHQGFNFTSDTLEFVPMIPQSSQPA